MPEDPGLLVFAAFVSLCLILLLYIQVVAPRRQRRRVATALLGRGWSPCDPATEAGAAVVLRLAIAGPGGAERATLHVSPEAWVLSAPLASAAPRIESLIEIAAEVSAHLD